MKKRIKIFFGVLRLFKEKLKNTGKLKIHSPAHYVGPGAHIWTGNKGKCDPGKKTWISNNGIFECNGGNLVLGKNNFFNTNCRIACLGKIEIGDNNLFGPNVVIVDHNHRYSEKDTPICKQGFDIKQITIGSDVWIGANVTICAGVKIADRVIVGANSVVTKDLLQEGIYAGCPAVLIKPLKDE